MSSRTLVGLAGAAALVLAGCAATPTAVQSGTPSPSIAAPTVAPTTPTPTPTPTIPQVPAGQVYTSKTPSTGKYTSSSIAIKPTAKAAKVNRYIVRVETSVDIDVDDAARQVQATLDDKRGWVGYGNNSFELVSSAKAAELTIYIVAPKTVDKLCAPLDTASKWNCRNGDAVVLNSDRWLYMTPTYDDLTEYRHYLVNHEVGHYLGQGHVGCPKKGGLAPVMMQQSINLGGCTPNAWPKLSA